jgi:hypothetical protein
MVLAFRIFIGVFLAIAGYFYWDQNRDGVFLSVVLAAVCFFLSMRFQIKAKQNEGEK